MVRTPYLSASRLKLFKDCELSGCLRYDPPDAETRLLRDLANHPSGMQAAINGTNVHQALEDWVNEGSTAFGRLMQLYDRACKNNPVDFDFYEDGQRMLRRWFNIRGMSRPKVIGCEVPMGAHDAPYMTANNTPIFGYIDLIVEENDGTVHLIDYKTQRAPMSQAEADNNLQAGIYFVWARENYPDAPLKFSFDLTRYGTVSTQWSDERIAEFSKWLKGRFDYIRELENPKPTIGEGCKWCPYMDICPAAKRITKDGLWDHVVKPDMPEDQNEIIDELQNIKAVESMLRRKKSAIEKHLKTDVFGWDEHPDNCRIQTDNFDVHWDEQERKEYSLHQLVDILPPKVIATIAKVNNGALERVLPVLTPEQADAVQSAKTLKPQRVLRVKRRK